MTRLTFVLGVALVLAACSAGPKPVQTAFPFEQAGLTAELVSLSQGSGRQYEYSERLRVCRSDDEQLTFRELPGLMQVETELPEGSAFRFEAEGTAFSVSSADDMPDSPSCIEVSFLQVVG